MSPEQYIINVQYQFFAHGSSDCMDINMSPVLTAATTTV